MFDIPQPFANAGYFQGFDRYLWYAAMALNFVSGIVFLLRMKGVTHPVTRNWYLSFALFSFCYGITRLLFNLAVDFGYATSGQEVYDLWVGLGYITSMPGVIAVIYVAEKNMIPKTHRIITLLMLIMLGAAILGVLGVYPRAVALTVTQITGPAALILIVFIYIFMIRNSTGALRSKTLGAFLGIFIWFVAIVLDGQTVYSLITMPTLLPPILYILGVCLYTIFQRAS